jgi:hypothetical protein
LGVWNVHFVFFAVLLDFAVELCDEVILIYGLGFRVWGVGFRIEGLGFSVQALGSGFRV